MVSVTFEELHGEGDDLSSTTLDLLPETKLTDVVAVLKSEGYRAPDAFVRARQDGSRGPQYIPGNVYDLEDRLQRLEVTADCPSSFVEQRINIDDTFLHYTSLGRPGIELSAQLADGQKILIDDSLELEFHRTLRMPDDNKIHPLPASQGRFPLYNVDAFASRLPERITKRGGVFFPMWQREALWINFHNRNRKKHYAIRVNVGNVNAISGLDIYETTGKQDYIVVPGQDWLDGIAVGPGVVRQFVAMPLGSGYTVEGQVTGKESVGGIQIEVIPSHERNQHTFAYTSNQGQRLAMEEHGTPHDYYLNEKDILVTSAKLLGNPRICDLLDDAERLDGTEELTLKTIYLEPNTGVEQSIRAKGFWWSGKCSKTSKRPRLEGGPGDYYGMGMDFSAIDHNAPTTGPSSRVEMPLPPPPPPSSRGPCKLAKVHTESSPQKPRIESLMDSSVDIQPEAQSSRLQEMGIAAGGKLMQDITKDTLPRGIWNTSRKKLLDIHILHPLDFEAVTHIVPPPTPITKEEYIAAGIPFYAVEEDPDERLDGSTVLAGVKSVSAMDEDVGVQSSDTNFDPLKPKRCAKCAVRLCDCMYVSLKYPLSDYADINTLYSSIRPCNHQFCHVCIRAVASPTSRGQRRCPVCSTNVSHVAGFSAPMNIPGEETFKVDVPVIMLEVEDGRAAFQSVVKMRL
ncbi:RING finger protein [Aspergillus mulundensis]|uniref:RING-type domain-containing protein n=1 Tax=Aspergillus mulundensis TaxID=1810919 RepID=A0A3D8SW73_9EURO|nr:hypothetical protein DSM5745_01823 [Aspergillus mulundensis]RDW90048.1 hypothetical protein DSM5745_01823 [Aspergillus mulundensis]